MQAFAYARPATLDEAIGLLRAHGDRAVLLAGGTDLVIDLRNRAKQPEVVVDLKRISELRPSIREENGNLVITAGTVMADLTGDDRVRRHFPALVEAADVVGSVQIRNRATLAGNVCNGSPAADTTPVLLVHGAVVDVAGPEGRRRLPIDEFVIGAGKVALGAAELVTAIELPLRPPVAASYQRLTRRRGTDLASITLCCGIDPSGVTRLAYGSVGPRAFLVTDTTGLLADPGATEAAKAALLDRMLDRATPSPTSMRAGPEYRLAMLRVLGARALQAALQRRSEAA